MSNVLVTMSPVYVPVDVTQHESRFSELTSQDMGVSNVEIDLGSSVKVIGDKIEINPSAMTTDNWVEADYKGKKYLIHKHAEDVIKIFRVDE